MGNSGDGAIPVNPVIIVVIPIAIILLIIGIIGVACARCRRASTRSGGYAPVQHALDEEEMHFKQVMESKSDNIDDIFVGATDSDLAFDSKELDRLSMLEKYRDRLVAADTAAATGEIPNEKSTLNVSADKPGTAAETLKGVAV
jgi:hypothetical protein